ncbi:armadillo-type protein, partial [Protomyces lactucae-debilis]
LKLLLRRERVSWSDTFINKGGLLQLARLVSDLCIKEWRDDQDDSLLQQLLGCYQALCTTERGRQALKLDDRLLIMLVELLFSDKQPADYTTRTQIMKLLHQFVTTDADCEAEMSLRALVMLQDQIQPILERPLDFLAAAHTSRPYKRWMRELDKPVRECFWIFLHDNSIPIVPMEEFCMMEMRKPIVPQGYVGGVEWIVIEYICSHLQLINTMLRALASEKRYQVRVDLKQSHFEKILNRLRRASQTYYEYLHEELMTWASLAHADGWSTD